MKERTLDEATRTALGEVAAKMPDSEQQYFSLQMAWVEMLDAREQLKQAAESGKPVDIKHFREACELEWRIKTLQRSIRHYAYDPTFEELGVQDDDDPHHDPEYREERFMPDNHPQPSETE